jgi:hypothetical protein
MRPPEQSAKGEGPLAACGRTIDSVRRKADRNERLARVATGMIIVTSTLIPVSIIISTQAGEFAWGRLVPSILAATAATTAGILQFERPHERWKLYRGYQRALEAERFRYEQCLSLPQTELVPCADPLGAGVRRAQTPRRP